LFEIRIREVIRQLIEAELLFHAWFNRSEVQSIKGKLNERIQEINALIVSHSPTNNEQINRVVTTKEPKKKKAKVEKGSTQRLTLEMLRSGKTIQEIALGRELKATTICSHLAGFIELGELKLNEILSSSICEKLETAMREFPTDKKLGEALSTLSNQFAADEIVLGFAWKKYNSKNDPSN
jgi:hypothetical protein